MIGLFQENGPCNIDSNGNVVSNPYSWSNFSNMLYIDNPTQVSLFSLEILEVLTMPRLDSLIHKLFRVMQIQYRV
jgi:hypothetical protein